ncbi:MAG: hypothetical protein ACRC78_05400 [Planktothrix sp.]
MEQYYCRHHRPVVSGGEAVAVYPELVDLLVAVELLGESVLAVPLV